MDKSKIKSVMITACILLTLVMGYSTYMNILSFIEIRRTWIQKNHELVKLKNEIDEIERLLNYYRREKGEFEKYLFQEKDVPAFLDGLSGFAQNAGISIVDMKTNSYQEVKVPPTLKEGQSELAQKRLERGDDQLTKEEMSRILTLAAMPINLRIQGPYSSLIEFYRHLENFKQLISISNVDIATTQKYPTLECGFTLKIYSLKTLEELKNNRK